MPGRIKFNFNKRLAKISSMNCKNISRSKLRLKLVLLLFYFYFYCYYYYQQQYKEELIPHGGFRKLPEARTTDVTIHAYICI